MNNRWITRFGAVLLLAALNAGAQPPPPDVAPDGRPPGPPPPHVQRYFEMVREKHPEEFERMRDLRATDPEAFRRELGERLHKELERRGGGDQRRDGPRGERSPRTRSSARVDGDIFSASSPELEALEERCRTLAREFRAAAGDEARSAELRTELQGALARAFDLREKLRSERVSQVMERLTKVQAILADRTARRDELIQRRLNELTREPPPDR